jgi:hypothetical protein
VTTATVAIWETRRPPAGIVLLRLQELAEKSGRPELKKIFENAAREDKTLTAVQRQQLADEAECWRDIRSAVVAIRQISNGLEEEAGLPDWAESIREQTKTLMKLIEKAQGWSWRNQR